MKTKRGATPGTRNLLGLIGDIASLITMLVPTSALLFVFSSCVVYDLPVHFG
jgi:hypothetical protein